MVTRYKLRRVALPVFLFLAFCLDSLAMERWAALSQIESGDNDSVVGTAGEVSRYQIKREVWQRFAHGKANWKNPTDSLSVAQGVMNQRCAKFERLHHRRPNDFEFYVLWNAPAQIERPGRAVRNRACRFCQLIGKESPS